MSLVAGPGRGGATDGQLPDELRLVVDKHVAYIQSLDTVCLTTRKDVMLRIADTDMSSSEEMNLNIILLSISE